MSNTKKAGYYLSVLIVVLMVINLIVYLMHVSDRIYVPVVILMVLSIVAMIFYIAKPVKYFEYAPMVLYLLVVFFYFTTEASYISVCYLAVDDSFKPEYLFQIFLTLAIGIISTIPPVLDVPRVKKK